MTYYPPGSDLSVIKDSSSSLINILLVEDNIIDRMAFSRSVKQAKLPYNYTIATCLKEAITILNSQGFEIIILDYNLGDGYANELFPILKARNCPFIISTGSGDEEIAAKLMGEGAYDYLIKDPDCNYLKVLPVTVNKAIARHQSEEQLRLLSYAIQSIKDSIYIANHEGKLLFINDALKQLCQVEQKDVVGENIKILEQPELTEYFLDDSHSGVNYTLNTEISIYDKNHTKIPMLLSESHIQDSDQKMRVGLMRDITTLKNVELSLRHAQENLEKKVEERTAQLQIAIASLQQENQERLQVEASLRSSRDLIQKQQLFLKSVIDSNPNLIFVIDGDGNYLLANQAMATFYQTTVAEMLGKNCQNFSSNSLEAAGVIAENRQIITTGQELFKPEKKVELPEGAQWFQIYKRPIKLPEQDTLGVVGVAVNITDRKIAELQRQMANDALYLLNQDLEKRVEQRTLELQAREAQLWDLFDNATDLIQSITPDGQILLVNRAWKETLGYHDQDLEQLSIFQIIHPDEYIHCQTAMESLFAGHPCMRIETKFLTKDGREILVEGNVNCQFKGGKPIATRGIFRDITQRKQADNDLRESQQFLQTLLDTLPLYVFWKNRELVYLGCNHNFAAAVKIASSTEIIGKTDYDLPWGTSEAELYRIDDRQVIDSGRAKLNIIETQHLADGKIVWVETNKVPLCNVKGEVIGILGTYQNITNRKEAEIKLHQQAERERLLREITQRIRQSLDIQTIFDTACQEIRQVIGSDRVCIFKFDPISKCEDGEFVAESVPDKLFSVVGIKVHDYCFGEKYASLYSQGNFYAIDDIYHHGLTNCHSKILEQFQIVANLVMPLLCGEQLWGLLCVHQCSKSYHWQESEIDLTRQLANQLAIAIQQVSLYDQIQSELLVRQEAEKEIALQLRRQKAVGAIIQRIRESLDLQEILATVTQEVKDVMQCDRVIVFRLFTDGSSQIVEEAISDDFPRLKHCHWENEVWSQDILDCYWQGKPRIVPDVMTDIWTNCLVQYCIEGQIQSKIVAPILQEVHSSENHRWMIPGETNKLWGVLVVHACREKRIWQESEAELLQQIANQLAIAIQQAGLFKQLQQELAERQLAQQQLTERNQELAISNQQLARATHLKDEFLANMSHELRTPLNAILGLAEGLQEQVFGQINQEQVKALQTIERSGSHLLELINDILDVAKIESGQIKLEFTPTQVAPLCQSSLTFIKQQALKKRINLEMKVPQDLPDLLVDELRIRQVLINLLNNAVKFTPTQGLITLEVTQLECPIDPEVDHSPSQNFLRISISDTGIGIASENISKLFQPFMQIDSALNRQYSGTGLGLTLVKRIVELHGGQVGLVSEVSVGSCFMIDLPVVTDLFFREIENNQEPRSQFSQVKLDNSGLILLVEDNEANITTISSYLQMKKYQILVAKNALDAIALAKSKHPDLILMDISLPGMDGLEAIHQIRQYSHLVNVPIIALTALAMKGDRERCLAAGANDYLSKPVKLKQLTTTIQKFLNFPE